MEKKISYEGMYGKGEFTATKPDDCSIKITKDEYSVIISVDKQSKGYIIGFSDGWGSQKKFGGLNGVVESACEMILDRPNHQYDYKKLCSELETFYNKL